MIPWLRSTSVCSIIPLPEAFKNWVVRLRFFCRFSQFSCSPFLRWGDVGCRGWGKHGKSSVNVRNETVRGYEEAK